MEKSYTIDQIDTATVNKLVEDYPDVVPEKLSHLDKQRYEVIPLGLKERKVVSLTKPEVATLVDWKLSHGKFRPSLKALLQQNTEQVVLDVTRDAFLEFSRSRESATASLKTLTKLRGIGPATASLLLSVYDPQAAPFFSDELFRWCMWEQGRGKGWDREIKYNVKEYLQLFEKVKGLQKRLNSIDVVDIEKAAYVMGKRSLQARDEGGADGVPREKKRKAQADDFDSGQVSKAAASTKMVKTKTTGLKRKAR